MQITYTPEGAEPRTWDFEPKKLMSPEAEAIERHTGWTFDEFAGNFLKGSTLAKHAVLFVMLKRSAPQLKWDDVQFALGEVEVGFSPTEQDQLKEALEAKAAREGLDEKEQNALEAVQAVIAAREPLDPKDETTD